MVGWEMFTWEVEKSFTNVGGNLNVEWGVEPNNVAFSVAARFRIGRIWIKSKLSLVSALPLRLIIDGLTSSQFYLVTRVCRDSFFNHSRDLLDNHWG